MRKLLLAGACLLCAAPAFAETLAEKTGVNSVIGVSPTTGDFVTEAAQSGLFEIQSSRLAQQKGDGAVKSFAAKMVADHTKIDDELKKILADGTVKVSLPTGMTSSQQSMLQTLQGLDGNAFDTRYDSDQVSAHKDAVSLFQRYADGGENPALKAFAKQTLPTLQDHLKMAQNLNAE
jgi:putative membrane protein